MSEHQIRIEIPVNSALKAEQKESILKQISNILKENDCGLISTETNYIEKRSFEIPLILVYGLGVSASILGIINAVFGIFKKLGKDGRNGEIFVKRKDGTYAKIKEDMTSDDVKKLLE